MGKPDIHNGIKILKGHLETKLDIMLTLRADLFHKVSLLCE